MAREAGRSRPLETGGVLMGYWTDSNTAVISTVVGPGPKARHERHAFWPDTTYQDAEIERIYEDSGQQHSYLGDWHTHPNGSVRTSQKDRKTLLSIALSEEARAPEPLMAILGGAGNEWDLAIWVWAGRDLLWKSKVSSAHIEQF